MNLNDYKNSIECNVFLYEQALSFIENLLVIGLSRIKLEIFIRNIDIRIDINEGCNKLIIKLKCIMNMVR
jgi:hypothetical protein